MAPKYRRIDPRIWHDEKFKRFNATLQHAVFYLLTTWLTNRIGLYHLSLGAMAEGIGAEPDVCAKYVRTVCSALGWKWDEDAQVMYIPTWFKYNPVESPDTMKGLLDDLHALPESDLVDEFLTNRKYLSVKVAAVLEAARKDRMGGPSHTPSPTPSPTPGTGTGSGTGSGTGILFHDDPADADLVEEPNAMDKGKGPGGVPRLPERKAQAMPQEPAP